MQLALMKVTRRVTSSKSTLLGGIFFTFFIIIGSVIIDIGQVSAQTATLNIPLQYRAITPAERSSIEQPNVRNVYGSYPAVINDSGTRTINEGFNNPRQSGEYSTGVFYAASAQPSIPACAQNIEARLGGNFTLRYRGNNGSGTNLAGPVGRWGNNYNVSTNIYRDYPEVYYRFFHSGAFWNNTAQQLEAELVEELVGAGFPLTGTQPSYGGAAYEFRVYSSPPAWHSVTASQAEEFTLIISAEIMDHVSNGGRQWSYNVTGNPELQVRWNNVACLRNRPYMHINGGDVYSGASFDHTRPQPCTPTSRAANSPIITNGFSQEGVAGNTGAWLNGTSQSQYAVFASGLIGGNGSPSTNTFLGNYGYHTRPSTGSGMNPLRDVLFANQGDRGSYYAGAGATMMPCVGDISEIEALITEGGPNVHQTDSWDELRDFIGDPEDGIMVYDGDADAYFGEVGAPSPSVDIVPGVRKVIIVDGNLHIQGNIEYPGTYNSLADIPYVQFIARGGNIYLDKHVTRHIDAHLMALPRIAPDGTQTRGIIDTCATHANRGQWITPMSAETCYKQPTPGVEINGSMIARRIYWKNTSGTLGQDGEYIPSIPGLVPSVCSAGVAGVGGSARSPGRYAMCAAELVNFYPEAHLRHYQDSVPNTYGNVPVSTQELPPIY